LPGRVPAPSREGRLFEADISLEKAALLLACLLSRCSQKAGRLEVMQKLRKAVRLAGYERETTLGFTLGAEKILLEGVYLCLS